MKIGDRVHVCYDSKYSRKVEGEVIAMKRDRILVRFPQYEEENHMIEHWFRKDLKNKWRCMRRSYCAWVPPEKLEGGKSLMQMLCGFPGDHYRVWKKLRY